MIIITFISVLERKKEIGIRCAPLVHPGGNIASVFNAGRVYRVLFLVLWVLALRSYSFARKCCGQSHV